MRYPIYRSRRVRKSSAVRQMVKETIVTPADLLLPLFAVAGNNVANGIPAMPGVYHHSVDKLVERAKEAYSLGVPAVLLFGLPENKDDRASEAYSDSAPVQRAVRALKSELPELTVMTDVCLCAYMSHGHCGVIEDDYVDNDKTLELLVKTALSHAKAGADFVAPSDMMDGRVAAIRQGLDEAGFSDVGIMSYAAKYASGFYGPFREAAHSAPAMGDRSSYQMDPANVREALREVKLDEQEGADMVMVKPALAYLDVISRVRKETNLPLAAYNVSGEYSMIKAAAARGWLDEERAAKEMLTSIKRAGADVIITYYAIDAARWFGSMKG